MCNAKIFFAIIFNEIKCHVNTSLGLVGGMHPLHPPLCPRLPPNDTFLRLQHGWHSRRRKCKGVFMIHNFENTESWEDNAGKT